MLDLFVSRTPATMQDRNRKTGPPLGRDAGITVITIVHLDSGASATRLPHT